MNTLLPFDIPEPGFTPEKLRQLLPIMQAFADGRELWMRSGVKWVRVFECHFRAPISDYSLDGPPHPPLMLPRPRLARAPLFQK